jgi:hypothetical protein
MHVGVYLGGMVARRLDGLLVAATEGGGFIPA